MHNEFSSPSTFLFCTLIIFLVFSRCRSLSLSLSFYATHSHNFPVFIFRHSSHHDFFFFSVIIWMLGCGCCKHYFHFVFPRIFYYSTSVVTLCRKMSVKRNKERREEKYRVLYFIVSWKNKQKISASAHTIVSLCARHFILCVLCV